MLLRWPFRGEEGKLEYVVVGIGINIYEPSGGFPEEIKDVAGAVFTHDIAQENMRNRLSVEFLVNFMKYYQNFPSKDYLEAYRRRSFVVGKRVRIITPGAPSRKAADEAAADREYAQVLGIDDACHLKVQYDDGTIEFLSSGEISIKME